MIKDSKKINLLNIFIYLYIFTPLFLFQLFWLKPVIGFILDVLLIVGVFFALRSETPLWKPELNKRNIATIILVFFLLVMWIVTSGIGASVTQYPDHLYRNGLFRILVDHDWPVRLSYNGVTKGMSYYIGFWIPAALIAKVTSYQMGFLFMQIWAIIGMCLVFFFICEKKKKIRLWYLIVFAVFGGADYLGYLFIGKLFTQAGNSVEWWAYVYNFPGVFTSTFWVYNQIIYAWVIFSMIMRQKNNKNILFLWSAALLNCTFPAVGMIPFAIYKAIENVDIKDKLQRFITAVKECFSWQFGVGLILSLISTIYLTSNFQIMRQFGNTIVSPGSAVASIYPELQSNATVIQFNSYPWTTKLYIYLWFVFIEFVIHFIIIYESEGHKPLYWLTLIVLLACPLIKIGGWIDFCMRGPIPGLFILYHFVLNAFENYHKEGKKHLFAFLVILMAISSMTSYETLKGVMNPMAQHLVDGTRPDADSFGEEYIFNANNFFADTETPFFKYLAKDEKR